MNEEKQTAISQLERVKRANKDLVNSNHLLKQELENLSNQVMILEEEKALTCEIGQKSEELLSQNITIQMENRDLFKQIETLKDEIRKNSTEFENQIALVINLNKNLK